ncbi:proteasome assembly chaperone family protein [Candidatus Bathyarchaeota archaeon]|nr:MAG: proteasome assembly chaperone family protein [Candidatus Bathyarchaeota archaeon]
MDKTYFHNLFHPKLEEPVFVEGLPGFGNVGKIAARLLIKLTKAKLFTELYSPSLPDYVIVNANGICRPPRYEFYASSTRKPSFIILTGDAQPSLNDLVAHYKLCGEILDFAEEYGSKFIITIGGVPMPNPAGEVYVAATSKKLAIELMEKGAALYGGGRIMGATGLLLGIAKSRGWKGACLLGATTGLKADKKAALLVFNFLKKMLRIETETEL